MRTHHNLAEVAGRYKDEAVWPLVRAFTCGEPLSQDSLFRGAEYDPIILGFILGRSWPAAQEEALAAIERDLEYDRMLLRVSPKASSRVAESAKKIKGIDLGKLEFNL